MSLTPLLPVLKNSIMLVLYWELQVDKIFCEWLADLTFEVLIGNVFSKCLGLDPLDQK